MKWIYWFPVLIMPDTKPSHFGLTTGAPDRKMIDNLSIELIGILYSFRNKDWNTSILDYLHESFPHSKICMMIDFPDGYDQELLMVSPHIDYVLRGEREQSFCELVGLIERHDSLIHCPGLTYRDSENRIIKKQLRSSNRGFKCPSVGK